MSTLEAIKTEIERSLPPGVITAMREAGIALTLDSASDVQPVVSISDELAERELLGEMASFGRNVTGVDNTVFISAKGYARHGPRIKLAIDPPNSIDPTSEAISIAIDSGEVIAGKAPPARLLKQVQRFIELNHDVLIDYWNSRFLTDELVRRLKPIK